ncbi:hypothetical protein Emag_004089 [Eimeria magna]
MMRQWAVGVAATVAGGLTCACIDDSKEEREFLKKTEEDAALAEAVAAAGGELSVHLTREFAEDELKKVEELLEIEPDCKGALEAKLRLLRVLRPHDIKEQLAYLSELTSVDNLHKCMREEEQNSVQVRIDAADSQLTLDEEIWFFEEKEEFRAALKASTLKEIDVTRTPLASSLASGSIVLNFFQFLLLKKSNNTDKDCTSSVLRRKEAHAATEEEKDNE